MRIVFVVDSMERFLFFQKLACALKSENHISFVSSEPLAVFMARLRGFSAKHIFRNRGASKYFSEVEIYDASEQSIEVLNGGFSISDAVKDASTIADSIYEYITESRVDRVIIWNGQQLLGRAAKLAANKAVINTRFLELSNLPRKLFSDSQGVNALSSIVDNIDVIDKLPEVKEQFHLAWLKSYELYKDKPLPQGRLRLKQIILSVLNLGLKFVLKSTCLNHKNRYYFLHRLPQAQVEKSEISLDRGYIFLPLQVSSDTQIKLHSEYGNIDAIKFSHQEAKRVGVPLVVKIHPAERSSDELSRIYKQQEILGFYISSANTVSLLKAASSVITINSTVGLEALLYGRSITVLGNCFYSKFDNERLKKYIHHFLIDDIDYFDNTAVSIESAAKLIGLR